ncbi:Fanconi anemia group I protein homolog [Euwallacea similis]|uniref:Fanconi anemia group I protein homolog n=1 Tax=Euwallacea similis TaxID=1736056 RepID=UPI003450BD19
MELTSDSMDFDQLETYAQNFSENEIPDLEKLINSEGNEKMLENLVERILPMSNFPRFWDLILKAFQNSPNAHEKRFKLILVVLRELDCRECLPSDLRSTIVQRLCMDLLKLKTEHLVDLCNICLNSLQDINVRSSISWKELLPELLRILSEKDMVIFNDLNYTGQEFKSTFLSTLCMINWCPDKVIQLTSMFSDMPLSKEEHQNVVIKLVSYIHTLIPQELPPFVYQLLRLCRQHNCWVVFVKLQQYFGSMIYSQTNTDSPDLDCIETVGHTYSIEAESIVLYHIQSAATKGHSCIKDYLNSLKNTMKSPEFILHPFQLLVLLTISTVAQYEETAFDILRHSIVRCYNEENKANSSYWYRDIIKLTIKPQEVFAQVLNIGDREVLLEAFANFGFALLNVGSALGRDVIAEQQWNLGTMILLKIIKKKLNVVPVILKTFCNHILTRQSARQYIECLYFLSKTVAPLMHKNQSCILELIESFIQIPSHIATQLIDALMPLTTVSHTIRDQFILILRKSLYSRPIETRRVAVYGYVKLIATLDITNGGAMSQNSMGSFSSGYSIYTQISLNRSSQAAIQSTFSNEAICWEVLGILKRCFMQQAEVRMQLYDDLCNAVLRENSQLAIPILDVFWFHLMEYYVLDEEVIPPLNVFNISVLKDSVYQEPLGKFILSISQIVAKANTSEDDRESPTVKKYTNLLNSLCKRMSNCELMHFELDDGSDLTDSLPESQLKLHILREMISVFEALMGYKIAMLSPGCENQCGIINSLFQGYLKFLQFGKNLSKPKKTKKADKNTPRGDKTTQKSQTQYDSSRRIGDGAKNASKTFKCPDTLLDLSVVEKGLRTLLESTISWASSQDANTIRSKTELHRHFMQAALFLIGRCKNFKPVDSVRQKKEFDYISSIAKILYNRVIKRLSDYIDFDCTAAMSCLECFHAILQLINTHYRNNSSIFFSRIGKEDSQSNLHIIETFEKLFDTDEYELSNDVEIKKFHPTIISNLISLSNFTSCSGNAVQMYEWLKQLAYNNTVPVKVAGNFMSLFFDLHLRDKSGLTIFTHVSCSFLNIFGPIRDDETITEETDESLKIINAGTANAIILSICASIKNVLEDVESVIAKIKSDYHVFLYSGGNAVLDIKRDDLKSQEKGITCQLCLTSQILTNLVKLAIPRGHLSDAVFKDICQFYSTLSSFTKYLISRTSKSNTDMQGGWFEKLTKLVGRRLAPAINDFIYHLEMGQKEDEHTQPARKKSESEVLKTKILRETKLIPKVVYEMEQFSRYVMQLSRKTKYDFSKYVGQGTSRDFRINLQNVQEDLRKAGATQNYDRDATLQSQNDSSRDGTNVGNNTDSSEENEENPGASPAKRSRQ